MGKKLLWTTGYPHNLNPLVAEKIQAALKKAQRWGWQVGISQTCACTRQRIADITRRDLKCRQKPDHTPKNNGNQCDPEKEPLIVHLVKTDPDAAYNVTAKHAAMIIGDNVSANLVIGVRKRNRLEKKQDPGRSRHKRLTAGISIRSASM